DVFAFELIYFLVGTFTNLCLGSKKETAKKRHNTGRPEATDDGDKLRNCSIEGKGYEDGADIDIQEIGSVMNSTHKTSKNTRTDYI
ncbi:hypothetical protein L9F63_014214, partial [Diploptera punctata]